MDDDIESMIEDLVDIEDGLTGWEVEFVENVSHWDPEKLSQNQIEKIRQLHSRYCG